jgi:membrane protein YqaA with SNARE-associated domain
MFDRIAQRLSDWVRSKHLLPGITLASFLESIVVPIPIETLLIPVTQMRRDKAWWIATVATLGCVAGALVAYGIGFWLFASFEPQILGWFDNPDVFTEIQARIHAEGFWFIVLAGIAPIPLQLAMLAAGVSGYHLGLYVIAIALSRMLRYFGIAWLVLTYGDRAEHFLRKYQYKTVLGLSLIVLLLWAGQRWLLT